MYINGELDGSELVGSSTERPQPDGQVVLGREYTDEDVNYADVTVDELYFWDEALGTAAIEEVYNWYR